MTGAGAPDRRLLIALAGAEDESLVGSVATLIGGGETAVDLILLHVIDSGARGLLPNTPGLRAGTWPRPRAAGTDQRLVQAEDEGAAAVLDGWRRRFAASLSGARVETSIARGRPEQVIISEASARRATTIVLCARPRSGTTEPGPRSVGHVARFVVDHAPVPVLLVRRAD